MEYLKFVRVQLAADSEYQYQLPQPYQDLWSFWELNPQVPDSSSLQDSTEKAEFIRQLALRIRERKPATQAGTGRKRFQPARKAFLHQQEVV